MPAKNTGSGRQLIKSEFFFRINPASKGFLEASFSTGHTAIFAGIEIRGK